MLPDYHVHTKFSIDGTIPMEEMCERAIALGMEEIAFTDHVDYDAPYDPPELAIDYETYLETFTKLREKYLGRLRLTLGVEIGVQPQVLSESEKLVSSYPFDFVIASNHVVDRLDLHQGDFCRGKTREEAYRGYLTQVKKTLSTFKCFNVAGHLDYIRRYGGYENNVFGVGEFSDLLDPILKNLIENGRGIEINTSGIRGGSGSAFPSRWIVERYRALGGEIITVGSDAHFPEHIAKDFDEAQALLLDCGFKYYTVFREMRPEFVKIS